MYDSDDYPAWNFLSRPSDQGQVTWRTTSAKGHVIEFADGSRVLDATSGLWNANLGYGNEAVADAISLALREASYLTLFRRGHTYAGAAARALIDSAGSNRYGRVLFSTSGSAANDAAMKLARHYAHLRGEPERRLIIGLKGSYHGQTFGAMSLCGDDLRQELYGVDANLIRHVSHTDAGELAETLSRHGSEVAGLVVEPILGTGAHEVDMATIKEILDLRDSHGFLLICDEVATGFGRTGSQFASDAWPSAPDVLIASKGLTNGTCAAAALLIGNHVYAEFERADEFFIHGETQAGTPPTCAAILAVLKEFEDRDVLAASRRNASLLKTFMNEAASNIEMIDSVSGAGCFRALHLRFPDGSELSYFQIMTVIDELRSRGVLVYPGPSAIQLVPDLTYDASEIARLLELVAEGLTCVGRDYRRLFNR